MKKYYWILVLIVSICIQLYISNSIVKVNNSPFIVVFIILIFKAIVLSWIAEFISMKVKNRKWEIDSLSVWYLLIAIAQFLSNYRILFPK
jgi:hypothetical protein